MIRYILKRILYSIFVLFILSMVLFGLYKSVPGDPARMLIPEELAMKDPERYQELYDRTRASLGLDKPIYVQYISWAGNMIKGNFGVSSIYKRDVVDVVKAPLLNTVKLNVLNLIFVFAITIPLGISTAVRKGSTYDNSIQVFSVVGMSLPSFIFAILFIFIFSVKLKICPIANMVTVGAHYEGVHAVLDRVWHMVLPVLVLTISSLAGITRQIRGAMIDALKTDYVRTARAKGLREKAVIYSHAFRNVLIPVVTIFTWWFVGIFGGSMIVESVFLYKGMGSLMINSLLRLDFSLILTMNMFYIVLTLLGNLLMDISYVFVDPRVKLT